MGLINVNIYLLMSVWSALKLHSVNGSSMHVTGSLIISRWLFPHEGWIRNLLLFISLALLLGSKANLLGYMLYLLALMYFLGNVQVFSFSYFKWLWTEQGWKVFYPQPLGIYCEVS
jgi:hypothetical protein